MLTRTLHTAKSAILLTASTILIGCGAGTSPMAPDIDNTYVSDGTVTEAQTPAGVSRTSLDFNSDGDAITGAPTPAGVSGTSLDFNSDIEDIFEIDATGFDANLNDLSQNFDDAEDESAAWYNDDDITNPKEEDVLQNPDSGNPENG